MHAICHRAHKIGFLKFVQRKIGAESRRKRIFRGAFALRIRIIGVGGGKWGAFGNGTNCSHHEIRPLRMVVWVAHPYMALIVRLHLLCHDAVD
jgi:hypothetical protein